ncbi:hypothetical protein JHK84_031064 [Glycine max]|nr:hypothetical protein JHK84_031064 [Glycine max]
MLKVLGIFPSHFCNLQNSFQIVQCNLSAIQNCRAKTMQNILLHSHHSYINIERKQIEKM